MTAQERETIAKLFEYSQTIGNHKPDIDTKFWRYREAVKIFSRILYANFGAWEKENPYQKEDQEAILEGFSELDKLIEEL